MIPDGDGTVVYTGAPCGNYGYSYPYYGGYSYPYYGYQQPGYGGKIFNVYRCFLFAASSPCLGGSRCSVILIVVAVCVLC